MKRVPFYDINVNGGFWKARQELNAASTIPAVLSRFTETGRFEAMKCSWREGMPNRPHIFWDSDIAKWLESVAYLLESREAPELEKVVEDTIDMLEAQQTQEGYINSYFTSVEPSKRWTNRDWHELYCCGHLIEAAVAWKHATGRDRFERIMCRYADYVIKVFAEEESAAFSTPGHEEIELALVKLYRSTGEKRYLDLAKRFIDLRGNNPKDQYTDEPAAFANQSQCPVREMTTAEGHSVRAGYLYSAMADIALETGDDRLLSACEKIFDNLYNARMYVTGGVGSTHINEAFTADYDLPNLTAYTETCASIALAYFAGRMLMIKPEAKYADAVETVMYNGFLSGVSLDGRRFFYSNPMELDISMRHNHPSSLKSDWLPAASRVEVFSCSCCPPNVTRFTQSIAEFAASESENRVYLHQYMDSTVKLSEGTVTVSTDYPLSGSVKITAQGIGNRSLCVRIPAWCEKFEISSPYTLENGYAVLDAGDKEVSLSFDMTPALIEARPEVWSTAGKVCVRRGPVIYCAEAIDNEGDITDKRICEGTAFEEITLDGIPLPALRVSAVKREFAGGALYRRLVKKLEPCALTLIPYFAFGNRGETDMKVWLGVRM